MIQTMERYTCSMIELTIICLIMWSQQSNIDSTLGNKRWYEKLSSYMMRKWFQPKEYKKNLIFEGNH